MPERSQAASLCRPWVSPPGGSSGEGLPSTSRLRVGILPRETPVGIDSRRGAGSTGRRGALDQAR